MISIDWSYEAMREWYSKQAKYDTKNVPVYGIVYESFMSDAAKLEPFVSYDMKWMGVSPVQNKELFPNDLYILMDSEDSKKKWLFFVFPLVKYCFETQQSKVFGDHFSFCLDASDKNKPCHILSTGYTFTKSLGDIKYISGHTKDYMPDQLKLPASQASIFKKHVVARDTLLSIIKYPWTVRQVFDRPQQSDDSIIQSRPVTGEPFHREFCEKWVLLGIQGMQAIGIRKGSLMHWSVSVFKGRLKRGRAYQAMHYTTPIDSSRLYEQALWKHFVQDFVPWWDIEL
jgi:hypothetical protein